MEPEILELSATIARHDPGLPRYVVVPDAAVRPWRLEGTTVLEGTIDGTPLGRRSLKRWDAARWFIDLPESLCRKAGVDTGDEVTLELRIASTELPEELARLLARHPGARERWHRLSASRRRMIREHVLAAQRPETRRRRARKALGVQRAVERARALLLTGSQGPEVVARRGGSLREARQIFRIHPEHTPQSRRARVNDVVIIQLVIDREGCVEDIRILKGPGYGLEEATRRAARWWVYEPATRGGEPVSVHRNVTSAFRIGGP